ncbi:MAG: archaeal heat shock protein Hsp20 [Chloroflexota bacterium]
MPVEARYIVALRGSLGLSQERFARLLGVSMQSVRRWESGLTRPIPIIAEKLEELSRQTGASKHGTGGISMAAGNRGSGGAAEISFGGLFKGVGSLLDLVSKMAEEGQEETSASGEVETAGGKVKGVYGFSVRVGLGGKPVIHSFGNIRETEKGPVVTETREPLVDVLDEGDHLTVVAEVPGVEEKNVQLKVEGDILEIVAASKDRKYEKQVLLPYPVDSGSVKSSYRNGVLEVSVTKK